MASRRLSIPLLSALLLFSGGCASYPISKEMRELANQDLSYSVVIQNPDAYTGNIVIWGGIIFKVINHSGGAQIIIWETPLDSKGSPDAESTHGLYIAETWKSMDPKIFQEGRKITLAGQITGEKIRPLGVTRYTFPVVWIIELHLWKKEMEWEEPWSRHGWHWDFYNPYTWPYGDDLGEWDELQ